MGSVAKHVFLVTDPTRLEATVRTAFEIARTGRPGPVVVDIPKDVQNWSGIFRGEGTLPIPGYRRRSAELAANTSRPSSSAAFVELLAESQRPLHLCRRRRDQWRGGRRADRLRRNPEHSRGHDADGHRRLDTTHALSMRMLGMHGVAAANYAVEDCDFLIAVGARFDDRVAGNPQKFARAARAHRAPGRRPVRDQQGQERALEPRRAAAGRPASCCRAQCCVRRGSGTTRPGTRTSRR